MYFERFPTLVEMIEMYIQAWALQLEIKYVEDGCSLEFLLHDFEMFSFFLPNVVLIVNLYNLAENVVLQCYYP